MVLPVFFFTAAGISNNNDDDSITQFSESQLDKMKSKCMEVDQKGFIDSLKFKDTNLWLMCMQLILEEKNK
jgi:hypothetical protein